MATEEKKQNAVTQDNIKRVLAKCVVKDYPLAVIRKELGVTWLDASLLRAAALRVDRKA